jgi:hypothetical protein
MANRCDDRRVGGDRRSAVVLLHARDAGGPAGWQRSGGLLLLRGSGIGGGLVVVSAQESPGR